MLKMQALKNLVNLAEKHTGNVPETWVWRWGQEKHTDTHLVKPTELNEYMRKQAENAPIGLIRNKEASAIWGDMQYDTERWKQFLYTAKMREFAFFNPKMFGTN